MKIKATFLLKPQRPEISFSPDYDGPHRRPSRTFQLRGDVEERQISILKCGQGNLPRAGEWCGQNGYRLATGFELMWLLKQVWDDYIACHMIDVDAQKNSGISHLDTVVALGDKIGEWYVMTHGGFRDHTPTWCTKKGFLTYWNTAVVKL